MPFQFLDDDEMEKVLLQTKVFRGFQVGENKYKRIRNPFTSTLVRQNFEIKDRDYFEEGFNYDDQPFYLGQKLAPISHNYQYGYDIRDLAKAQRKQFKKLIDDDEEKFIKEHLKKYEEQYNILGMLTESMAKKGESIEFMNDDMWKELVKEPAFNLTNFILMCYWYSLRIENPDDHNLGYKVMWAALIIEASIPNLVAGNSSWPIWLALIPATWAQLGWKRTLLLAAESVLLTEGVSYYMKSIDQHVAGHSICSSMFAGQAMWTGYTNWKTLKPWTRWLAPIPGIGVAGLNVKLYWDDTPQVAHAFHALGVLWGMGFGYQMNNTNLLR